MKVEQQVVSLGLSKRLKSFGVREESHFWWTDEDKMLYASIGEGEWRVVSHKNLYPQQQYVSAYTVGELGEIIKTHEHDKELQGLPYPTLGGRWRVDLDDEGMLCAEENEANARAKVLIYLLENGLITV